MAPAREVIIPDEIPSVSGDIVTRPDPTRRVTEQLQREISAVREIFEANIKAVDIQFSSVHKEMNLIRVYSEKRPEEWREERAKFVQLFDEKIEVIKSAVTHLSTLTKTEIEGVVSLIEKTGELNNTALQAAFAAAKESVATSQTASATANNKMETNFTKQLDATSVLISTMEKSLNSKIEDVKVQALASVPRAEASASTSAISERVSTLEKLMASQQGALLMASFFASAIPTIVAVLLFFLRK